MMPGVVAGQFKGIPASPVLSPSWTSPISEGNRMRYMRITTFGGPTTGLGEIRNWIDGSLANGTGAFDWVSGSGNVGSGVMFDFDLVPPNIEGFRIFQSSDVTQGTWSFEGSNNLASWVTLTTFVMQGSPTGTEFTFPNGANYRYYRFVFLSGIRNNSPWQQEIHFYAGYPSAGSGTTFNSPVSTGDRRSLITVTGNVQLATGDFSKFVDGPAFDLYWVTENGNGSHFILFDFGITPQKIDGLRFLASNDTRHGRWVFEGSDDNSTWDQLGQEFTLIGSSTGDREEGFINNTFYRYYRLRHLSGTRSSSPWLYEFQFRAT